MLSAVFSGAWFSGFWRDEPREHRQVVGLRGVSFEGLATVALGLREIVALEVHLRLLEVLRCLDDLRDRVLHFRRAAALREKFHVSSALLLVAQGGTRLAHT